MFAVHALSLVAFIAGVCYFSGATLVHLFDLYSFLALVFITVPVILASGRWKSFFSVLGILRNPGKKHTLEELKNAGDSLKLLMIVPAI
jgi:hypothetical protein